MVIPFGLGVAVAVGIYNRFIDTDKVSFGHFLLFIGVGSLTHLENKAMSSD
jgi:hypothetical protein